MKLRVFVAMRFGAPDTDALFDTQIKPVVESMGFTAIRIDRKNHNDYIDRRILKEIDEAHLCLTDLTYARPSVYYEAGYAEGQKDEKGKPRMPVIYTVRTDHLDRKADNNVRVHFDLSMKNIIDWQDADDPRFADRLRERINLVAAPLLRQIRENAERKLARERFNAASPASREEFLRKVIGGEMQSRGYRLKGEGKGVYMHYEGKAGRYTHHVAIYVGHHATKSILEFIFKRFGMPHITSTAKFVNQVVVVTLDRVGKGTAESLLNDYATDWANKRFFKTVQAVTKKQKPLGGSGLSMIPPRNAKHLMAVDFIDHLQSAEDALEKLDLLLELAKKAAADKLPDLTPRQE